MSITEKANYPCNRFNRFNFHKEHLERLILIKGKLDNSNPFYPKFFNVKASKHHSEKEGQNQIDSDNNVLLKKMAYIGLKPSPYSKSVSHPKYCPVFDKVTFNWYARNEKEIVENTNNILYKKYKMVKTIYPIDKFEKHNDYQRYLGSKIIRKHKNPCLSFVTFHDFKKRIQMKLYTTNCNQESKRMIHSKSISNRGMATNNLLLKTRHLKPYSSQSRLSNSTAFNSLNS